MTSAFSDRLPLINGEEKKILPVIKTYSTYTKVEVSTVGLLQQLFFNS